jgi:hypothetical protein
MMRFDDTLLVMSENLQTEFFRRSFMTRSYHARVDPDLVKYRVQISGAFGPCPLV